MKLRVVELLLVTTLPALFLAAKGVPPLGLTIATLIGGTLAAGQHPVYYLSRSIPSSFSWGQTICNNREDVFAISSFDIPS